MNRLCRNLIYELCQYSGVCGRVPILLFTLSLPLQGFAEHGRPTPPLISVYDIDHAVVRALSEKNMPLACFLATTAEHPDGLTHLNLLKGVSAYSGMPNKETLELALSGTADRALFQPTLSELKEDTYIELSWRGRLISDDVAEVVFKTALIDGKAEFLETLYPDQIIRFSRSTDSGG